MTRAIVVGSGAGGAAAARDLQGPFDVTILEAGREFRRLSWTVSSLERIKKTGLLLDEREISLVFPPMRVRKAADGMVIVSGKSVGGTTTICTGNGVRMDGDLRALGIDLDAEFAEIYRDIPVSTAHERGWHETTQELYEICREMNLDPRSVPKMGAYERCAHCGRCVLGCPCGVKWDSGSFVRDAQKKGAQLVTGCTAERVVVAAGRAVGIQARHGRSLEFYPADLVVLAAGGLATPLILQNSGISCEPRLFVDPVLCVAGPRAGSRQCYEVEMPFTIQRDHYILSPYFDYLSFLFNRAWHYPAPDIACLMIKLADENVGAVSGRKVIKTLTTVDKERLREGVALGTQILTRLGVPEESVFLGTVNGGHPGGMLPLTKREAESFHHDRLPANLYVADATLFPKSLGNPPILTITAMARRVAKLCVQQLAAGRV